MGHDGEHISFWKMIRGMAPDWGMVRRVYVCARETECQFGPHVLAVKTEEQASAYTQIDAHMATGDRSGTPFTRALRFFLLLSKRKEVQYWSERNLQNKFVLQLYRINNVLTNVIAASKLHLCKTGGLECLIQITAFDRCKLQLIVEMHSLSTCL
jgi:hypothetical protein